MPATTEFNFQKCYDRYSDVSFSISGDRKAQKMASGMIGITPEGFAAINQSEAMCDYLVVDCRSFLEYNDGHIIDAVNIASSKLIRKRLENNKVTVIDLLRDCNGNMLLRKNIIIYDQRTSDFGELTIEHFFCLFGMKLVETYGQAFYLEGGFTEFGSRFPRLCETQLSTTGCSMQSFSTPCLPNRSNPPSKILPFLYLGCEDDAQNEEVLSTLRINFVLNVSTTAKESKHISHGHYLKIPVQDSVNENIEEWFPQALDFIDKVRESDGSVLVHCVGGVSRSATIAIAYVMRHLGLSLDNAYRFVKEKRPFIAPNLNFMGQLLKFQNNLEHRTQRRPTI